MSRSLRLATFTLLATLWTSGCVWIVLHYAFAQRTDFGPTPNPWEPVVMRVHGWAAVGGVFLLGWIGSGHISERWFNRRNRTSGLWLMGSAAVLVISGYALYYTTDRLHDTAGVVHEIIGVAALLIALTHWRLNGRLRSVP
jgi:hypothetical protein